MKRVALNKLIILLIPVFLLGCGNGEPLDIIVPVAKVESMVIRESQRPEVYAVSGRIAPAEELYASFKTGGFIEELLAEEGDSFQSGTLLARLDTTEIAAFVRVAVEHRAKLERDQVRIEKLYAEKVVSLEQLQDLRTTLESARADERRARFTLERSAIHAPFSGVVASRMVNTGEMIEAGQPVLRLVERKNKLLARVAVPARFIPAIALGDFVELIFKEVDYTTRGAISEVGAVAKPGTGHYEIEITFPADPLLREGMAVRAEIPGPLQSVIALPTSALVSGNQDRGRVFVVSDSHASLVSVDFVGLSGDSILVKASLPAGSRIITAGAGFLRDGSRIEIVETIQ
jgi:RND family efflux transporter MFP subunit